jgi:hypothetical protein
MTWANWHLRWPDGHCWEREESQTIIPYPFGTGTECPVYCIMAIHYFACSWLWTFNNFRHFDIQCTFVNYICWRCSDILIHRYVEINVFIYKYHLLSARPKQWSSWLGIFQSLGPCFNLALKNQSVPSLWQNQNKGATLKPTPMDNTFHLKMQLQELKDI